MAERARLIAAWIDGHSSPLLAYDPRQVADPKPPSPE
jgi:hypothetical protein